MNGIERVRGREGGKTRTQVDDEPKELTRNKSMQGELESMVMFHHNCAP